MQKINFQNLPSTTTPLNATNMNAIQTNTENAINIYDLYNDTSGNDWQTMMKNKIDYCISTMDNSKQNTSAFINGGWSGVNFGFGICSKIESQYQLMWHSLYGNYYCRKINNNYDYKILDGNNYSFDESIVGHWVNGKNLYRQTFSYSNISRGQEVFIAWNNSSAGNTVSNIDEIVNYKAFYKRSDGTFQQVPNYHYDPSKWASSIYDLIDTGFTFYVGNLSNVFTIDYLIITIEYTKTTD